MEADGYYRRLFASRKIDELRDTFLAYSSSLNCDYFIYVAIPQVPLSSHELLTVTNYPASWNKIYTEGKYLAHDPTVRHCMREMTPIYWNEIDSEDHAGQTLMSEAAEHGLVSGVTMSVHSTKGVCALLSLVSSEDDPKIYSKLKEKYSEIYLFAVYLHEMASKIIDSDAKNKESQSLSDRERSCLLWAAEGKTSWEISVIQEISERTVRFHLNNATEKLGAVNRQHAVARAIALGLIRPDIVDIHSNHSFQLI